MEVLFVLLWLGAEMISSVPLCSEKPAIVALVVVNIVTFLLVAFLAAIALTLIAHGPPPRDLSPWLTLGLPLLLGSLSLVPVNSVGFRMLRG